MDQLCRDKVVLITGGAGFIGSHLCDSFLEAGNVVRCFDNLATGFRSNISHLISREGFAFYEGDIRDIDALMEAMQGVDLVLHQAALGSVPRSINDPLSTNAVNITGFLNVLEAARMQQVKRVVYAASSSSYGDSLALPKVEEHIGMPLSPYAVTKYANELYAHVYANIYGLELVGLRYFNVFGKRQTPNGAYAAAIPRFIEAFISHRSPEVHGDGLQTRDFTYIVNVLQMNHLAASTDHQQALNQVYNVAFGDRTSLIDLLTLIRSELLHFDPSIADVPLHFAAARGGDVRDSLADISKAKTFLGYKPTHDLRAGIAEAMPWYWSNLQANSSGE